MFVVCSCRQREIALFVFFVLVAYPPMLNVWKLQSQKTVVTRNLNGFARPLNILRI